MSFLSNKSSSVFLNIAFLIGIALVGHFLAFKLLHVPSQMEMVAILTVCFFYPVLRHPILGIYLLFAISPFIPFFRRLYYLQYSRPSSDPLIILGDILIVLMVIGLFFEFREQKEKFSDIKVITRIILVYFVYLVVRTFFFNICDRVTAILRFQLYGPSVLLFFLGVFFAQNYRTLRKVWVLTSIIGSFAALYGLKQLLIGYSQSEQIWFSTVSFTTLFIKGIARPFSFLQSPAAFADYMQLSFIGIIVITSRGQSVLFKYLSIFLVPLYLYGMLITSVRSNWLGLMISAIIWILVVQFKSLRSRIVALCIIVALFFISQSLEISNQTGGGVGTVFSILGSGLNPEYADLLVNQRTTAISDPFQEHSMLSRISLWKLLFSLSRDPIMAIMGRGTGALNADSLYVTYLAEFGYPGAFFIIAFTIILIVKGFSLLDNTKSMDQIALARGIIVLNIVFAIINITGTHIHSFPGDAYFWFWNGVLIKLESVNRKNNRSEINEVAIDNRFSA